MFNKIFNMCLLLASNEYMSGSISRKYRKYCLNVNHISARAVVADD